MALVVIIDDDIDDVRLLTDALEESPYTVRCLNYQDPVEALTQLASETVKPDYIFLDMNMPVLNGHDCLRELRSQPRYDTTVIVLLSTGMNRDLAKTLKRDGADFVCGKPHEYSTYRRILRVVFNPNQFPGEMVNTCYN